MLLDAREWGNERGDNKGFMVYTGLPPCNIGDIQIGKAALSPESIVGRCQDTIVIVNAVDYPSRFFEHPISHSLSKETRKVYDHEFYTKLRDRERINI